MYIDEIIMYYGMDSAIKYLNDKIEALEKELEVLKSEKGGK